ncbi:hypothetical protein HV213_04895 [Klebsiella sp. RHBSTW-00484]|uniref:hypothetical protein n=1 Tax=unclassified Klebsiella TaxID=2608929 RepID=UPI0015E59982|nr:MULTISPECIES: hypothetical protein [unclassified Klebsiella]MBA7845332.1 hypothetical protein [Klebsiella sp. RHBSTW-00465]QLO35229.1 hypothetical protein HV213_04895 [Klebsiella sp. RHBSTW-00484]QLT74743.1 hypothetical protein HV204_04895 [Klebsiella sp. RHBSTW-00464]
MLFVKVEVTPEESRALLLQDEELQRVYQEAGGGRITTADWKPPRSWYVNEEEDASICLLCRGTGPWCDPRHLYILRINKNYIVFQLVGFTTVRFIHNSSLLDNDLYRVKYLILAGLNSVGYWGLGITDTVDLVLDPVFEFAQELRS